MRPVHPSHPSPQKPAKSRAAGPEPPQGGSGPAGASTPNNRKPLAPATVPPQNRPCPSAAPSPPSPAAPPARSRASPGAAGGTAVSGLVTAALDPNFVPETLRQLHSTVTVTGTNGKTTTTAALCALARAAGQRVLTNPTGSNLERGLAAALLPHVGWNGQVRHASQLRAVLELDEWAFAALAPAIRPRVAVFLNLFRDQLDRYGEVDRTAAAWQEAIDRLDSDATVVANADDPAVVAVAPAATADRGCSSAPMSPAARPRPTPGPTSTAVPSVTAASTGTAWSTPTWVATAAAAAASIDPNPMSG